ncbi:hypothetical protein NEDG_01136 [Nematocida displodere]|uniref:Uncharacterized protein n=1 Tax=Nematocida displodere TaxID=1805483 RepID=A0A177EAN8_9MICR|nr:hypothetical protein NEDG_01136 [Nematocida displodere]
MWSENSEVQKSFMAYTKREALKRYSAIHTKMSKTLKAEEAVRNVNKKLRKNKKGPVALPAARDTSAVESEKESTSFIGISDLSLDGLLTFSLDAPVKETSQKVPQPRTATTKRSKSLVCDSDSESESSSESEETSGLLSLEDLSLSNDEFVSEDVPAPTLTQAQDVPPPPATISQPKSRIAPSTAGLFNARGIDRVKQAKKFG